MTDQITTVNIRAPLQSLNTYITLNKRSGPFKYQLPSSLHGTHDYDKKDTTVEVTSDYNIFLIAYTDFALGYTMGTFTVIPFSQLGHEYFVMSYIANREGFILISASDEPCFVNVTCSDAVEYEGGECSGGEVLNFELGSYQSIQLKTRNTNVTGTHITANTQVSVVVGAVCTNVPRGIGDCDIIMEQLLPLNRWGNSFILTPIYNRLNGYVFQVLAGRDYTSIFLMSVTAIDSVKLHKGQYHISDVTEQVIYYLEADGPISVMQYSKGSGAEGRPGAQTMLRVPPMQHYVRNATFPVSTFAESARQLFLSITQLSACDKEDLIIHHNSSRQEVITKMY